MGGGGIIYGRRIILIMRLESYEESFISIQKFLRKTKFNLANNTHTPSYLHLRGPFGMFVAWNHNSTMG